MVGAVATKTPDVLAVHDPVYGEAAERHVPVIVASHLHKHTAARKNGTLVLTVDSTGATGLGSFTVDISRPYEAEVLRFVGHDLVSVNRVELRGVGGGFRVERQLVTPPGHPELAKPGTGHLP